MRADFAQDGCEHQTFAVVVDDAQVEYLVRIEGPLFGVAAPCDGTQGDFLEGRVTLDDTYAGNTVEIGFAVETFGTEGNDGGGVFVDDVSIEWNCTSN